MTAEANKHLNNKLLYAAMKHKDIEVDIRLVSKNNLAMVRICLYAANMRYKYISEKSSLAVLLHIHLLPFFLPLQYSM